MSLASYTITRERRLRRIALDLISSTERTLASLSPANCDCGAMALLAGSVEAIDAIIDEMVLTEQDGDMLERAVALRGEPRAKRGR